MLGRLIVDEPKPEQATCATGRLTNLLQPPLVSRCSRAYRQRERALESLRSSHHGCVFDCVPLLRHHHALCCQNRESGTACRI